MVVAIYFSFALVVLVFLLLLASYMRPPSHAFWTLNYNHRCLAAITGVFDWQHKERTIHIKPICKQWLLLYSFQLRW